jgi:hypothetical protein
MSSITLPKEIWDQEVMATENQPTDWLWHGFVARGSTTLLTGMWKAGKTTLLSLLLSRRKEGGFDQGDTFCRKRSIRGGSLSAFRPIW